MVHLPENVVVDAAGADRHLFHALVDQFGRLRNVDATTPVTRKLRVVLVFKVELCIIQRFHDIILAEAVLVVSLALLLLELLEGLVIVARQFFVLRFIALLSCQESIGELALQVSAQLALLFHFNSKLVCGVEELQRVAQSIGAVLSHVLVVLVFIEPEVNKHEWDSRQANDHVDDDPECNDGVRLAISQRADPVILVRPGDILFGNVG